MYLCPMINIYEKFGNYALDISKYVLTGFVLASFFSEMESGTIKMYITAIGLVILFFLFAVWAYHMQNKKEDKSNNNKKRGGKK